MLVVVLSWSIGVVLPEAEYPWPQRIGVTFPFALAGGARCRRGSLAQAGDSCRPGSGRPHRQLRRLLAWGDRLLDPAGRSSSLELMKPFVCTKQFWLGLLGFVALLLYGLAGLNYELLFLAAYPLLAVLWIWGRLKARSDGARSTGSR